jgi:hypothetical protein
MFQVDPPRARVAANWGIAAAVYVVAGLLVAQLVAMIGRFGLRRDGGAQPERRSRTTNASTQSP